MDLFNIVSQAVNIQSQTENSASSALLYSFFAVAVFLLIQFFGARLFTSCKEKYNKFTLVFFIVLASLSLASIVTSFFVENLFQSLFIAVVGGVFAWTSLGEITEHLGWYKSHDRNAVWIYLLSVAVWLTIAFKTNYVPIQIIVFLAYPLLTWGTYLTRFRVIHKWGATSLASTLLMLLMACLAGGAIVAGALIGNKFSGVMAGLVFAITAWSVMEIIWERGMAKGPWKHADIH